MPHVEGNEVDSELVSEFALYARAEATSGHCANLSALATGVQGLLHLCRLLGPPPSSPLNLGNRVQPRRLSSQLVKAFVSGSETAPEAPLPAQSLKDSPPPAWSPLVTCWPPHPHSLIGPGSGLLSHDMTSFRSQPPA